MSKGKRQMPSYYAEKIFSKEIARGKALAEAGPHQFMMVLDNLKGKGGYNVAKIYRTAEAFGVREIHLVNIPFFDPLPAKGCIRKVKTKQWDEYGPCHQTLLAEGYTPIVFCPHAKKALHELELPRKAAFIVGHEEKGPSFDPKSYEGIMSARIEQFGQVESLNVSMAAGLAMYEWISQHRYKRGISRPETV